MTFKDRREAGQKLAEVLKKYSDSSVVYALPRGGVVLGRIIADRLNSPLSLIITRKIGHQYSPEYAICAVAEDGDMICNESERARVDEDWFKSEVEKEKAETKRRREEYLRGDVISPKGKTAIIVDDGIATGLTMKLAVKEVKHMNPDRIVVAVPASPKDVSSEIKREVDEVVVLDKDEPYLGAVGAYYELFPQVNDEEVVALMKE